MKWNGITYWAQELFWGQSNPGLAPWAALTRAFSPKSKPVSVVTASG